MVGRGSASNEVQYLFVPGRATTVEDWLLGAIGGLVATAVVAAVTRMVNGWSNAYSSAQQ